MLSKLVVDAGDLKQSLATHKWAGGLQICSDFEGCPLSWCDVSISALKKFYCLLLRVAGRLQRVIAMVELLHLMASQGENQKLIYTFNMLWK